MKRAAAIMVFTAILLCGCASSDNAETDKFNSTENASEGAFPPGYKRLYFGAEMNEETIQSLFGDEYEELYSAESEQTAELPEPTTASNTSETTITVGTSKSGAESNSSASEIYQTEEEIKEAAVKYALPDVSGSSYTIDYVNVPSGLSGAYNLNLTDGKGKSFLVMVSEKRGDYDFHSMMEMYKCSSMEYTTIKTGGKEIEACFMEVNMNAEGGMITKYLRFMTDDSTLVSLSTSTSAGTLEEYVSLAEEIDFSGVTL
ncbi:MAG: hypothetical protein IJX77_03265 [Ruminococcus sp.]|nr:hypothetical protein [Ruminococcus sp.]